MVAICVECCGLAGDVVSLVLSWCGVAITIPGFEAIMSKGVTFFRNIIQAVSP